jgi:TraM recognition site of TraD and TraG
VVYYWQKEFPLLKGKPQAPILTRLDAFLRPKLIRYMVSQKENRLDFRKIMDGRKIFLAKLAQGAIGEVNAYLLGALLVSKFHQLAMGRQDVAASDRAPFYLYIDEFQNFVTPSMAAVLSSARKYHLGLILAHQELRQLWSKDSEVASAVISNPATRICFRLGDADAKKLAAGFSFFDTEDLQNLGVGEAICRVERAHCDFNLKTLPLPKADQATARAKRERLLVLSREHYGRRREEIEAELARHWAGAPAAKEASARPEIPPPRPPGPGEAKRPAVPAVAIAAAEHTPLLGRGGQQHKYLQQLVKRWAESKGYRATIERPILDGMGSVDVALVKDSRSVACEISIASTPVQELGNIRKCLAAGFSDIAVISPERRNLTKLKETIGPQLGRGETDMVRFLTPEELFLWIESLEAQSAGREEKVRGYQVKVKYQALNDKEKKSRLEAISGVILRTAHKLKRK